jgi:L-ascorbate metabolism protein UlaG (beta-lactamase superfamily)
LGFLTDSEGGAVQIRLLRHATWVLRVNNLRVLTDPMLSHTEAMEPVRDAADLRRIPLVKLPLDEAALETLIHQLDAVLLTHLHRDHFDARAAEILPKTLPIICQPPDVARLTEMGFRTLLPVDTVREWQGVHITRTGGQHGTGEVGQRMGPVAGFVLRVPGQPSVYLAGDTIWCGEVEAAIVGLRPHVIVVNSGAAQFLTGGPITMTAEDVVRVCRMAPGATVVAVHLGAVNHCLLSRAKLGSALERAGVLSQVWIPADGETLTFP